MIKKRILLVSSEFPPQPGGIGNHALNLAKNLQLLDYDVTVLSDSRSDDGQEELQFDADLQFAIHRIVKRRIRFSMYIKRILLLFALIRTKDIVIASGKFSLWIVAFCNYFYKRNYIAVIHGSEVNFSNWFLRSVTNISLKRFSTVIAVSNYTKSLITHLNLPNITVIPNGINSSKWQDSKTEPIALQGYPKLITVGHVTARKGQLNVIKHLPELLTVYPELQYHCVGIPTAAEQFIKVAQDLGVDAHVHFHGRVSDVKLHRLLSSSDVFVMLSSPTATGDVEGFGIAILEANALGVPAIGAMGCGIEDAIKPSESGFLIPYNDNLQFIKALKTLLENPATFKDQAQAWAKNFDWNLIIKRYIDVIEED